MFLLHVKSIDHLVWSIFVLHTLEPFLHHFMIILNKLKAGFHQFLRPIRKIITLRVSNHHHLHELVELRITVRKSLLLTQSHHRWPLLTPIERLVEQDRAKD